MSTSRTNCLILMRALILGAALGLSAASSVAAFEVPRLDFPPCWPPQEASCQDGLGAADAAR